MLGIDLGLGFGLIWLSVYPHARIDPSLGLSYRFASSLPRMRDRPPQAGGLDVNRQFTRIRGSTMPL